jgi:diphthine-ammonia ligase
MNQENTIISPKTINDKPRFVSSWSGGKDSCYALMLAVKMGYEPAVLLNMLNENGKVSRSHAIPVEILNEQARQLSLPISTQPASWENYEEIFVHTLHELKTEHQITHAVFGDIDLQAHRDWEEKVSSQTSLEAILPLWKRDRKELVLEMIREGIEAYIVSCNEVMGERFLGQRITENLIQQLEAIGVDACGENGEYHTLVVDAPLFKNKIEIEFGTNSKYKTYWFIEMQLAQTPSPSINNTSSLTTATNLIQGAHYYMENGLFVFTAYYHRLRGYCCKSGCRHCPYGFKKSIL